MEFPSYIFNLGTDRLMFTVTAVDSGLLVMWGELKKNNYLRKYRADHGIAYHPCY